MTSYDLTGIKTDAQPQVYPVAAVDLSGQLAGGILNAQRRTTSADRVVLHGDRCAEHCHDAVTGELVHRATTALHHRCHDVDEFGHYLAQPLRSHRYRNVHRMNNIGEQHRDLLVLGASLVVIDW